DCRDTRSRTRSLRRVALATASPEIDRRTTDVHRSVRDADRHGPAVPADQVRLSRAERWRLRHRPTESQGSVRQLAWTLVGRRPALSMRCCLARTGRLGVLRASDLRRRGAAGKWGQSPGHSPVQLWNARAPPRSIRVLTREYMAPWMVAAMRISLRVYSLSSAWGG